MRGILQYQYYRFRNSLILSGIVFSFAYSTARTMELPLSRIYENTSIFQETNSSFLQPQDITILTPELKNVSVARLKSSSGSKLLIVQDSGAANSRISFAFQYNEGLFPRCGLFNFLREYIILFRTKKSQSLEEFIKSKNGTLLSRMKPGLLVFTITVPNQCCWALLSQIQAIYQDLSYDSTLFHTVIERLDLQYTKNQAWDFTKIDLISSLNHLPDMYSSHPGNRKTLQSLTYYETMTAIQHLLGHKKTLYILSPFSVEQMTQVVQKNLHTLFTTQPVSATKQSIEPSGNDNCFVISHKKSFLPKTQISWLIDFNQLQKANVFSGLLFLESLINSKLPGTPGHVLIQKGLLTALRASFYHAGNGHYKFALQCHLSEKGIKDIPTIINIFQGGFLSLQCLKLQLRELAEKFFLEKTMMFSYQQRPLYEYVHPLTFIERLHNETHLENAPQNVLMKYDPNLQENTLEILSQLLSTASPDAIVIQLSERQLLESNIHPYCTQSKVVSEISDEPIFHFFLETEKNLESLIQAITWSSVEAPININKASTTSYRTKKTFRIANGLPIRYNSTMDSKYESEWVLKITHPYFFGFSNSIIQDNAIRLLLKGALSLFPYELEELSRHNGFYSLDILPNVATFKLCGFVKDTEKLLKGYIDIISQGIVSKDIFETQKELALEKLRSTTFVTRETLLENLIFRLETGNKPWSKSKQIQQLKNFTFEQFLSLSCHKSFAIDAIFLGKTSPEVVSKIWYDACSEHLKTLNKDNGISLNSSKTSTEKDSQESCSLYRRECIEASYTDSQFLNLKRYTMSTNDPPQEKFADQEETAVALCIPLRTENSLLTKVIQINSDISIGRIMEQHQWSGETEIYTTQNKQNFLLISGEGRGIFNKKNILLEIQAFLPSFLKEINSGALFSLPDNKDVLDSDATLNCVIEDQKAIFFMETDYIIIEDTEGQYFWTMQSPSTDNGFPKASIPSLALTLNTKDQERLIPTLKFAKQKSIFSLQEPERSQTVCGFKIINKLIKNKIRTRFRGSQKCLSPLWYRKP